MKLAKGLLATKKIVAFPDPKVAIYRNKARSLRRELRESEYELAVLQEKFDVLSAQWRELRREFQELKDNFDQKVIEEFYSKSDTRSQILEWQLEQALELCNHFKEIILKRPLVPVAVALGEQHKREARDQARKVAAQK